MQENNTYPAPQMQLGPGFRIRTAIGVAAVEGVDTPQTDNGCQFNLSYHLKGVCNTHCGGQHLHRPLSQSEFGRHGKWRECFCSGDEAPSVREMDTGVQRQVSTLSA